MGLLNYESSLIFGDGVEGSPDSQFGVIKTTPEQKESGIRAGARQIKFKSGNEERALWTDDQIAAEQELLVEQAYIMAAAKGLSTDGLGAGIVGEQ
jgi:hypothetical protein